MGKSALAAVVARVPEVEAAFVDGLFWFDLRLTTAMDALDRIGCTFGHDLSAQNTLQSRKQVVRTILHGKRVLLVLDNVSKVDHLEPLLLQSPTVSALVTTRDSGLGSDLCEEFIKLEELTDEQGTNLIASLVGEKVTSEAREVCQEMARFLQNLPLALELVGKRLRKQSRRTGFSWQSSLAELYQSGGLSLSARDRSLRATFDLTYDALDPGERVLFQRIGLMAADDLEMGVIVAATGLDDSIIARQIEVLLDLSVLRLKTTTQYSIHSLLHDYGCEKSEQLAEETRKSTFRRISDYFYALAQRDCLAPAGVEDIRPVLRSHYYAVHAVDEERARRVFPWFGDLAIPGFLNQHGHQLTLLKMHHDERKLANSELSVAAAEWQLGSSYKDVGQYDDAIQHLTLALEIYVREDFDLMIAKLSYLLGQSYAITGDVTRAIAHYEKAIKVDRKIDNMDGIALTMVQIGDLYRSIRDDQQAWSSYESALQLSQQNSDSRGEVISLIRLADMSWQSAPPQAINYLDKAAGLGTLTSKSRPGSGEQTLVYSTAFSGWDGARLLIQISDLYQNLLFNGHNVLATTATCLRRAIKIAREENSPYYEALAFYALGKLMEHLFLVPGRQSDLPAAMACYEMADELSKNMELPPGINPRERIDTRILPRLQQEGETAPTPAQFATLIEESLDRLLPD